MEDSVRRFVQSVAGGDLGTAKDELRTAVVDIAAERARRITHQVNGEPKKTSERINTSDGA